MKVLKDLYYTSDHEWIRVENGTAYIGITDYAQEQLGDIVYIELPEIDDELEKEDTLCAIESVKAATDAYMPVDGLVVDINEELEESPELLNADPYENWIVKIKLTDKSQLQDLMKSEEYEDFIEEEA